MRKNWLAGMSTALVLIGCTAIQVNQDYDPVTAFTSMQSYRWVSETQEKTGDLRIDNPLRDARIRAAVDRLLAEKGVVKSADGPPSFMIRYQYLLRQKIESDGSRGGIGFGIGSYGRHGGIAIGTGNRVREYDEASLVIDFVDVTAQRLLWRGTGSQRFNEYDDPAKATKAINTLVEKILEQFPPRIKE